MLRLAVVEQGDRDAEVREAAQEIAGAVERVDHEGVARLADLAAFLAEEGVVGEGALEFLYDLGLGEAVDFAGVILPRLFDHVEAVEAADMAQDDVSGLAGGLDHDGDGRLLHALTRSLVKERAALRSARGRAV